MARHWKPVALILLCAAAAARAQSGELRMTPTEVKWPAPASGGVGTLAHLHDGLVVSKADAVLAASIFHFAEHTVPEAKRYLQARGVPVRLEEAA